MSDQAIARTCRTLASEMRLRLLQHLVAEVEATPTELAEAVGTTDSNVVQHLQVLCRDGFVASLPRDSHKYYHIKKANFESDFEAGINDWAINLLKSTDKAAARHTNGMDKRGELKPQHSRLCEAVTLFTQERRLGLIRYIREKGPVDLGSLVTATHIPITTVIYHLGKLMRRGVVKASIKRGETKKFSLPSTMPAPDQESLLALLQTCWGPIKSGDTKDEGL
jgi:DNA-binding transcriptional ArsR family regulator